MGGPVSPACNPNTLEPQSLSAEFVHNLKRFPLFSLSYTWDHMHMQTWPNFNKLFPLIIIFLGYVQVIKCIR